MQFSRSEHETLQFTLCARLIFTAVNFSVKASCMSAHLQPLLILGRSKEFTGWTGVATVRVYGRITETIFDDVSGEHLDDEELPLLSTLQIPPDITDMLIVYPDDGDTDPCVAVRDRLGCISSWCI